MIKTFTCGFITATHNGTAHAPYIARLKEFSR